MILKKSNMKSVCLPTAGDSSFRIFNPLPSVPLNYSGQNPWALYSPQMSFSPLSPTNDISLWSKLCQRNLIKFVALWARFSYQEKNRLVQPKFWVQYQSSHCLFPKVDHFTFCRKCRWALEKIHSPLLASWHLPPLPARVIVDLVTCDFLFFSPRLHMISTVFLPQFQA